jgi:hypothetical protein
MLVGSCVTYLTQWVGSYLTQCQSAVVPYNVVCLSAVVSICLLTIVSHNVCGQLSRRSRRHMSHIMCGGGCCFAVVGSCLAVVSHNVACLSVDVSQLLAVISHNVGWQMSHSMLHACRQLFHIMIWQLSRSCRHLPHTLLFGSCLT